MPYATRFEVTLAAVRRLAADTADLGEDPAVRLVVYYVSGTRQYRIGLSEDVKPDDVRLDFPEGPLAVYVPRESFMRLWGYVLDVEPLGDRFPGHWGLSFRPPPGMVTA